MKHLRKFNEAYTSECLFEDFKDIMIDMLDDFNFEYEFKDHSEEYFFYDCQIYLHGKEEYELHDDIPSMNINFLEFREDYHQLMVQITNDIINTCVTSINHNISDLETLKNNLDSIIRYQKECSKLFEYLKVINDRLKRFSNCEHCEIGFSGGELRITFEIKQED
jgi:hypothetical protein